jgi:2-dehydropantoate 2-reductase
MTDGMKIGVFGVGGVGGLMAALLIDAGEDVVLIARGEALRAIRDNGLVLVSGMGNLTVRPRIVTDNPAGAGVVDLLIVGTKAWQLEDAAKAAAPMVGPDTAVMPVQNGVESCEILSPVLGRDRVLVGVVSVSSYLDGPGRVAHPGDSIYVQAGEQDNSRTPRVERIVEMFKAARMTAVIPDNVGVAVWRKMVGIAASSAVGALTRADTGGWRAVPGMVDLWAGLMRESIAVAAAEGVTLPADYVTSSLTNLPDSYPAFITSMQRDVMEGRPSELEAQIGVIVRRGRTAGLPTPLHDFVYAALLPQENAARSSS